MENTGEPPDAGRQPRRLRWGTELALLIVGQVSIHSAMAGTRMAAPLLALDQGYSKIAVGVLIALFAVAQFMAPLPAGRLAERKGAALPLLLSSGAAAAGAMLASAWPVYPVLCVSALLTGAAVATITITVQRYVGRVAGNAARLRQAFSWLTIAPALGNCLGPFAAGIAIDRFGYTAAFFSMALLGPLALVSTLAMRRLPPGDRGETAGESAWTLWRDGGFRHIVLTNWFVSASWDVHGFMIPMLGHERNLAASTIGSILAAFALSAGIVRIATPVIATRIRDWVLVCLAMAMSAVLFCAYPAMPSAWAMAACSAALGAALGSVQPTVLSMLHHCTPAHRRADALAMRLMLVNASNVATPVLFGLAGGMLGASGAFWMMGVVLGLGSRFSLRLRGLAEANADKRDVELRA